MDAENEELTPFPLHAPTPQKIASATPRPRRKFPLRWFFIALLAAFVFCLVYPPVFLFGVRRFLLFEAASHDASLEIGQMTGSIFEPISLHDVRLLSKTRAGTVRRLALSRLDAVVAWKEVVLRAGSPLIERIVIDGLDAEIGLPIQPATNGPGLSTGKDSGTGWISSLLPGNVELLRANLVVRLKDSETTFTNVHFTASDVAPGIIEAGRIEVREPGLTKSFSDVKGTTALQNSKLSVGGLKLDDGMQIDTLSADLAELAQGKTEIDFGVSAFGGTIRGEVLLAPSNGRLRFEATGSFSQISLEDVARFVDSKEPAGGILKEGKFTFRGSPREIDKATVVVRLEATDFLWGKRRWNSLVAGVTMFDRKLTIYEFSLKQSHNELTLTGEMDIPPSDRQWWQSRFDFDIAANIDNLTELSALFGPGFGETAGKMTIVGSVSGENESFTGQLSVAGSHLSYRDAPLDVLKAAIKLNGNELDLTSIEFSHKKDFLQGQGVVNILGEKRYWGELKASIADLALYSAFFEQPIAPQPFAGGLFLDWSGDGTVKAHSGAFRAQLKDIRPLIVTDPKFHPLDADLEGTYALENIFFSKFAIADAETSFSAKVAATPATLTLQSIKVQHKGNVWLQGDAVLPLSVWNLWQARPWNEVVDFNGPLKVNVNAQNLRLHDVALLTGHDFPIKGDLDMKLAMSGSLSGLTAMGDVHLRKGQATVATPALSFDGIDADITLEGQDLFEGLEGREFDSANLAFNQFSADGWVMWKNVRDPKLEIAVKSQGVHLTPSPDLHVSSEVDLKLEGPFSAVLVSGSARILGVDWARQADWASLLSSNDGAPSAPEPPLSLGPSNWTLQIACSGDAPFNMEGASAKASFDLRLTGAASAPRLTGRLDLASVVPAKASPTAPVIDAGAIYFEAPNPSDPYLALRGSTAVSGRRIDAFIFGALSRKQVLLDPPLDEETAGVLLASGFAAGDPDAPLPISIGEPDLTLQLFHPKGLPSLPPAPLSASSDPVK